MRRRMVRTDEASFYPIAEKGHVVEMPGMELQDLNRRQLEMGDGNEYAAEMAGDSGRRGH